MNTRVRMNTIKEEVRKLSNNAVDDEILILRNLGLSDFPDFTTEVDRALELFEPLLRKDADVFGIGMVFLGDLDEYIWEVNVSHIDVVTCMECGNREDIRISIRAEKLSEALSRAYLVYIRLKNELKII